MPSEAILKGMLCTQLQEASHCGNIHLDQLSPEFVFAAVKSGKQHLVLRGRKVNLTSQRYLVFRRSCTCAICGVEGTIMCLDKKRGTRGTAHFNLYGIKPSGRVVLMTKDHIVAKARGGSNTLSNYQTMCESCNVKKGKS